MAIKYPLLVEKHPSSASDFSKLRFQDKLLDELCHDYDEVIEALTPLSMDDDILDSSSDRIELQTLARKLEHEFLERLANHANDNRLEKQHPTQGNNNNE
jgi:hypothetical protein